MKVAILGAGWAGMAAALQLQDHGHQVTVFEASRHLGGRARRLDVPHPNPVAHADQTWALDNGQHILIGAYSETLRLIRACQTESTNPDFMRRTFVERSLRLPLADGSGLKCPQLTAINSVASTVVVSLLELMLGIATLSWRWRDKLALCRAVWRWRAAGFRTEGGSVAQLCEGLPSRVMHELIEPLCVSALNTPVDRACAQVFLRVLHDALLTPGPDVPSHLLLPRVDLSRLFVQSAAERLARDGGVLHLGQRADVQQLGHAWQVQGEPYEAVVLATSPADAIKVLSVAARSATEKITNDIQAWSRITQSLHFESIATVYAYAPGTRLTEPMLALHSSPEHPAQFVFDRGQLHEQQ